MLAATVKGIISQRLVPRADGSGRIAITEILTMTGRVHDMILDPTRAGDLTDVIAEGGYYGMQTFDQALYGAVRSGAVSMADAMQYATRPHDLKLLIDAEGHTHTTMDDLQRAGDGRAQGTPGATGSRAVLV